MIQHGPSQIAFSKLISAGKTPFTISLTPLKRELRKVNSPKWWHHRSTEQCIKWQSSVRDRRLSLLKSNFRWSRIKESEG